MFVAMGGPTGPAGLQGEKGEKGDKGDPGVSAIDLFRATRNTTYTLTKNVWTKIPYNVEEFDSDSVYDNVTNFRFVAPSAGIYLFFATVALAISAAAAMIISLYVNGVDKAEGNRAYGASGGCACAVSSLLYLNPGEYVEGWVFLSSTANGTIEANSVRSHFSGCRIA